MILRQAFVLVRYKMPHRGLRPPRALYIELTERCNANCVMCDAPKGKTDMDMRKLATLLYEAKMLKPRPAIYYNAMESLLHPGIGEIVQLAHGLGLNVTLTTNGILLEEHVDRLKGNLSLLWVSIDGVGEVHDRIRRVGGAYEKATAGIRKALEAGIRVGVSYCINEHNYGCLVETAEEMRRIGVKRMVFNHLNYFDGKPKDIDVEVLRRQIVELTPYIHEDRAFLPDLLMFEDDLENWYRKPSEPMATEVKCRVAWHGPRITASGEVKIAFRCFEQESMGNVFEDGIMGVWKGERYQEFRKWVEEVGVREECYRCCSLYG